MNCKASLNSGSPLSDLFPLTKVIRGSICELRAMYMRLVLELSLPQQPCDEGSCE